MDSKSLGRWLIFTGVVGLAASGIIAFTPLSGIDRGAVPGVSFLLILLGLCFYFPSMLEDNSGGTSTMRIAVIAVVMVFVFLYVKIGWNAGTFEEFTIDRTWVYILGIALGAKAVQRFGEEAPGEEEGEKPK